MVNEDRLVQGLLRHERWAHNEIYSLYYDKLTGSLINAYGYENKEMIEESVHDAFLKIFREINQFSGTGSLIGWCIVIAKNCYLNIYKSQNKWMVRGEMVDKPKTREIAIDHHNIFTNENPYSTIDLQLTVTYMEEAMTAKEMELIMKHAYGYSYAELGEEYGVTAATIGEKVRRGIGKIKQLN